MNPDSPLAVDDAVLDMAAVAMCREEDIYTKVAPAFHNVIELGRQQVRRQESAFEHTDTTPFTRMTTHNCRLPQSSCMAVSGLLLPT